MLKAMPASESSGWTLVVPVKTLVAAKTRLSEAAGPHRAALAVAIACDTVEAALSCVIVARIVVVTGDPLAARALGGVGAHVVGDPEAGLNAALRHGAREAVRLAPGDAVGALQADLPALRPAELALVLTAAAEFEQAFLPDAADVGTTFYGVRPGVPFTPGFGGESRDRHLRRGAKEICLDGIDSVRRDVDTPDDLRAALTLGLGRRTLAMVERIRTGSGPSGGPEPEDG
ncbi:2-phospho-L-lactate guanylyltransferase [Streptosporangium canum]|uniref:2-phospho-L-lactate guanylyltransferase n=1 Tax=Streptosporangium canum TaxID=324952 RepID=UPI00342B64F5